MWDSNTPLQLLNSMPDVLEKEHLEKLQMLLDADKYKNQLISGVDLCGQYAPFCNECNKDINYPCAVAYVNFMKAQGMDIEISPEVLGNPTEIAAEEDTEEQLPLEEEEIDETEEVKEKTKIRIAIARKKTLL